MSRRGLNGSDVLADVGASGPRAGVASVRRKALPPAGQIRLRSATFGPTVEVTGILEAPVTPSGYGGYGVVARPGQVGLTVPVGRDPGALEVQMVFDRRRERRSVEPDIRAFEQIAGYDALALPVVVEGPAIPHSFSREPEGRWVIAGDPEWGEQDALERTGRTYQQINFTLQRLQSVDPDAISAATTREFHRVRKGSELVSLKRIARHYGTTWFRLRKLNPKLPADPKKRLAYGTRVRLS